MTSDDPYTPPQPSLEAGSGGPSFLRGNPLWMPAVALVLQSATTFAVCLMGLAVLVESSWRRPEDSDVVPLAIFISEPDRPARRVRRLGQRLADEALLGCLVGRRRRLHPPTDTLLRLRNPVRDVDHPGTTTRRRPTEVRRTGRSRRMRRSLTAGKNSLPTGDTSKPRARKERRWR